MSKRILAPLLMCFLLTRHYILPVRLVFTASWMIYWHNYCRLLTAGDPYEFPPEQSLKLMFITRYLSKCQPFASCTQRGFVEAHQWRSLYKHDSNNVHPIKSVSLYFCFKVLKDTCIRKITVNIKLN